MVTKIVNTINYIVAYTALKCRIMICHKVRKLNKQNSKILKLISRSAGFIKRVKVENLNKLLGVNVNTRTGSFQFNYTTNVQFYLKIKLYLLSRFIIQCFSL